MRVGVLFTRCKAAVYTAHFTVNTRDRLLQLPINTLASIPLHQSRMEQVNHVKSEYLEGIVHHTVEIQADDAECWPPALRQMFCIDAPANVDNVDNFIKCCGGMPTIETIFSKPKERMQFKFRPDDPNSVPLFSGRKASTDLAVKVRRKKKPDGTYSYNFATFGVIDTTFHFDDKICDLQLLPTSSDIRNELLKSDFILNCDPNISLEESESSTVLKHFFYSRFTVPKSIFPELSEQSKRAVHATNQDMICQLRKSRRMFGNFINWDEENIPESLADEYKQHLPPNIEQGETAVELKRLFEQRPVWTRHALLILSKCRSNKLKYILPLFAYCYLNGPFRNLWVRYGYNPKKDKSSKVYQCIDCRYRNNPLEGYRNGITLFKDHSTERPDRENPYSYLDVSRSGRVSGENTVEEPMIASIENDYIFRPDNISIFKRTIYQLCDIEIEEVQAIIAENDGQESECTEKDGWCVKGAIDRIRKIMSAAANKMLENPEVVSRLAKQDLTNLEIDDIETSEVYDHLSFDDVNELLMIETRDDSINQ